MDAFRIQKMINTRLGRVNVALNQIYTISGDCYFITVQCKKLTTMFRMDFDAGKWKIAKPEKLGSWILEMENELSNLIKEYKS